jgi:hypothetical protein
MSPDDESTPPISSFGAQRAIAHELSGISARLKRIEKDLRSGVRVILVLLVALMLACAALASSIGK